MTATKGGNDPFYTIFRQGSSMRTGIFMAASRELYDRYKSDFADFLDSVSMTDDSGLSSTDTGDLDLPAPSGRQHPSSDRNPLRTTGNLVEPLSNGLQLSMSCDEIKQRFGQPTHPTWDARTFGYDDFGLICGDAGNHIWTLTLTGNVRLHSGIGPGSSRSEVARVFGNPDSVTRGQYQLQFDCSGDRVRRIAIRANGTYWSVTREARGIDDRGQRKIG